jgi:hypothetical protein
MMSHFGDLVQEYCIVGQVAGVDVTQYVEKMYYGTHAADEPVLSLMQVGMTDGLTPQLSIKIDFTPDATVTAGSLWSVGSEEGTAMLGVIRHTSLEEGCLLGVGGAGSLEFGNVMNPTALEGGSFSVSGSVEVADPSSIPGLCEQFEDSYPCCS